MSSSLANIIASTESRGALIAQGKTKLIYETLKDLNVVDIDSKDDITAGDGEKHNIMASKAVMSTTTTSNVFRLLKACGLPVAFIEQTGPTSFTAPKCVMLPFEVVVRREGHGSYLHRHPHLKQGHRFDNLVTEFFLKTKDKKWKDHDLVMDDPLMVHNSDSGTVDLYVPHFTKEQKQTGQTHFLVGQKPFLTLPENEVLAIKDDWALVHDMTRIAIDTFLVLEKAWQILGLRLVDFKVEFGRRFTDGLLFLTDVIDNDSWRLLQNGLYVDKQGFRDGEDFKKVTENYALVAELSKRFGLPKQQIAVWTDNARNTDVNSVQNALIEMFGRNLENAPWLTFKDISHSVHLQPVWSINMLQELVRDVPDTVVILIGESPGSYNIFFMNTVVPVVSLNSNDTEKVLLHTFKILAARNPALYMHLRRDLEQRWVA